MKRTFTVGVDPATGEIDEALLERKLMQVTGLLVGAGGSAAMVAERQQVASDPDEFVTVGALIEWRSTAPARRLPTGDEQGDPGAS